MSLIDKDYEEKRDFIRMTMDATATLTLEDGTNLAVKVIDLSATGMHLESNRAIAVNANVVVLVESPNAQFNSMEAQCTVVRCIELSETKFDIGLEVKSIT
jgi:hypothetical protein